MLRSAHQLYLFPPDPTWLLLAALTLISGLFTIRVPSISATISVSETFIFTSVLLFGTPAATITVALEALVISSWRQRQEARKVVFNATEPALSIWVASSLFHLLMPGSLRTDPRDITSLLGPVFILASTYFLLNSWLTAAAVGLASQTRVSKVWREHFSWLSLNYFVGASIALIIVQNSRTVGLTTLGIIIPLLAISYYTMKSSMGRLDDATKHIAKVEKLYLSTIESLAMAIDAKDQVTHGHIRRVQTLAVGLAKELGLQDPTLIKAIEASALLHDMGKLAVPEYILNKPGKLTAPEFERMKLHSNIGAEILSSIDFPYPVVPIVRHHHENWDGTGYPDGLSGASIPIGARILSVVDCFDALTSDRPYRRKVCDSDALMVLRERRGTMYDPLIVDTFLRVYSETRPVVLSPPQGHALRAISRSSYDNDSIKHESSLPNDSPPAALRIGSESKLTCNTESARKICGKYLASLFPGSTCVIYGKSHDKLRVVLAAGTYSDSVSGLIIAVGSGVSGWVAANRQIAINSDPLPDLGSGHRMFRYCVSSPVIAADGGVFGVVTIYSEVEPFTDLAKLNLVEASTVAQFVITLEHPSSLLI